MTTTSRTNEPSIRQLPFARSLAVQKSLPFEEAVRFAKGHGCTHLYVEGAGQEDRAEAWTPQRIREGRRLLQAVGVGAIFHGNYKLPVSHEDEGVREAAVRAVMREVDVASELSAPLIVHGSSVFSHKEPLEAVSRATSSLCKSVEVLESYATRKGVELWLENLEYYRNRHPFYTLFSTRSQYERVLGSVPGVRFILDVGHEHVGGDSLRTFERFSGRIAALDLNDNNGDFDAHYGLGRGTVDFVGLVQVALRLGWVGHITLETRGSSVEDDLQFLSEALKSAHAGTAKGKEVSSDVEEQEETDGRTSN